MIQCILEKLNDGVSLQNLARRDTPTRLGTCLQPTGPTTAGQLLIEARKGCRGEGLANPNGKPEADHDQLCWLQAIISRRPEGLGCRLSEGDDTSPPAGQLGSFEFSRGCSVDRFGLESNIGARQKDRQKVRGQSSTCYSLWTTFSSYRKPLHIS